MSYVIVVCDDEEDLNLIEEAFCAQPDHFITSQIRSADLFLYHMAEIKDEQLPWLIIINNYLPDMDSLTLLKKIKENALYNMIPVAVMAGFASEENIRQYYRAGANCFYKKPFDKYEWQHLAECLITLFFKTR